MQKMGIEIPQLTNITLPFQTQRPQTEGGGLSAPENTEGGSALLDLAHFTSPVLVNQKYTEQNQKKKLIWGSKKAQFESATADPVQSKPITNNKWEMAKFSHDSDGKVASKFLRLMGMKGDVAATANASGAGADGADPSVKKREEMFSSMEQQYEVARQVTHTMRGMGLGFGTQPRSF